MTYIHGAVAIWSRTKRTTENRFIGVNERHDLRGRPPVHRSRKRLLIQLMARVGLDRQAMAIENDGSGADETTPVQRETRDAAR